MRREAAHAIIAAKRKWTENNGGIIMEFIREERQTPIKDRCRVLVAGGGYAGVSAALAAARGGADVLLLEREFILGGLGTAGLITYYLPICDGMGHQVSFGIAEELLRLVVQNGLEGELPQTWFREASAEERRNGPRFMVRYNPQICALELERLLVRSGVRLLYGTSVCGVVKDGARISAVIVENKSGRSAIKADCVIDCTGDADICQLSGAPTALFPNRNPMAAWYYYLKDGDLQLNSLGACDVTDNDKNKTYQRIGGSQRVSGVDAWENSGFLQAAHAEMLRDVLKRRERGESCVPVTMATIPELRMTRRLVGETDICARDDHRRCERSVGMFSDWTKRGPVYELPFGALYHPSVPNLLTAGRCLSAADDLWNVTRVIPVCAVSGEAAGTAAALGCDFPALDIAALQETLRAQGVRVHLDEL